MKQEEIKAEKLLNTIANNNAISKQKNNLKRRFYINGDTRVLGSPSLQGMWNTFIYKLYIKFKK